jgi:hypothetical protein
MPDKYFVLIGDIVNSKKIKDRIAFNAKFQEALSALNAHKADILSPYTITAGDEIQAVFGSADNVFRDAIVILASIYPEKIRFSFSAGALITPVNPNQSIGMDGPAFYTAREGIDRLKKSGDLFHISGEGIPDLQLLQSCLQLLSFQIKDWKPNRLQTLMFLQEATPVKVIAEKLKVSEQAIYKTINAGALEVVMQLFDEISKYLNRGLMTVP